MKISMKFSIVKLHSDSVMSILVDSPYKPGQIQTLVKLVREVM